MIQIVDAYLSKQEVENK